MPVPNLKLYVDPFHRAKVYAGTLGFTLTFNRDTGEYRLCPRNADEHRAYYTPDLQDAIDTALTIVDITNRNADPDSQD